MANSQPSLQYSKIFICRYLNLIEYSVIIRICSIPLKANRVIGTQFITGETNVGVVGATFGGLLARHHHMR
jgi:hypothetical protein